MKAKKLAEMLMKNPTHEVRIIDERGDSWNIVPLLDVRNKVVFINSLDQVGSDVEEMDSDTMYVCTPKEVFEQVRSDDNMPNSDVFEDYNFKPEEDSEDQTEDFIKYLKKKENESKLKKLAKEYYHTLVK